MSDVIETVDQPSDSVETVESKKTQPKKDRKAPFTLGLLLDMSCKDPDNFNHYNKWMLDREVRMASEDPDVAKAARQEEYPGWSRYTITLHCSVINVIAKKHTNGGYHIRDYAVVAH